MSSASSSRSSSTAMTAIARASLRHRTRARPGRAGSSSSRSTAGPRAGPTGRPPSRTAPRSRTGRKASSRSTSTGRSSARAAARVHGVSPRRGASAKPGLFRRAVPAQRGDDLLDVAQVLVLVLEDPPHHLARAPAASLDLMIDRGVLRVHDREALEHHTVDGLQRRELVRRPALELGKERDLRLHHVFERLANAPHRGRRLLLELVRREPAHDLQERRARRLHLVEEVAELVLVHRAELFGEHVARSRLPHLEGLDIELLPVIHRHAARGQQREVVTEALLHLRDRVVARAAARVAAGQLEHVRREGAVDRVRLHVDRSHQARTHTFCAQSARTSRGPAPTDTRSAWSVWLTSVTLTPGRRPTLSRYSRKPGSCSN